MWTGPSSRRGTARTSVFQVNRPERYADLQKRTSLTSETALGGRCRILANTGKSIKPGLPIRVASGRPPEWACHAVIRAGSSHGPPPAGGRVRRRWRPTRSQVRTPITMRAAGLFRWFVLPPKVAAEAFQALPFVSRWWNAGWPRPFGARPSVVRACCRGQRPLLCRLVVGKWY